MSLPNQLRYQRNLGTDGRLREAVAAALSEASMLKNGDQAAVDLSLLGDEIKAFAAANVEGGANIAANSAAPTISAVAHVNTAGAVPRYVRLTISAAVEGQIPASAVTLDSPARTVTSVVRQSSTEYRVYYSGTELLVGDTPTVAVTAGWLQSAFGIGNAALSATTIATFV